VLSLESLRHVTTLDWVRDLPRLRYLDVVDLKAVETDDHRERQTGWRGAPRRQIALPWTTPIGGRRMIG
jgi:hypothetical protein